MDYTITETLRKIIKEETRYIRHYIGTVIANVDPLLKGGVLCTVNDLGWFTPDVAMWFYPRQMHAMSVPMIGESVEVYFVGGDPERRAYIGLASEMMGNTPSAYLGTPTQHVLFQDPITGASVTFDGVRLMIDSTLISLGANATEFAVLGTSFYTWLVTFITTVFNLHTHVCAAPGSPSAVPVPIEAAPSPTAFLSTSTLVK